ncbi:hypothetical protein PROFUN_10003 [Planoprotostelium fungivorum]|uniref:Sepiapterin reductase n=1 Tax=Planoprotostelium fungivorum TaxID=1890364 RepID=A0A2P6NFR8_9EUKA|nr:hypothetical protein PROFUN_10003 [Planoprotostelium fungivorum]
MESFRHDELVPSRPKERLEMVRLVVAVGVTIGYGKTIVMDLMEEWKEVDFILISRSGTGLERLTQSMREKGFTRNITTHTIDLTDISSLEGALSTVYNGVSGEEYEGIYLFNISGTLDPIGLVSTTNNLQQIRQSMDLNITSFTYLSHHFLSHFTKNLEVTTAASRDTPKPISADAKIFMINISSLCGILPFQGFGAYCTGKAARDMFYRVIAEEARLLEPKVVTLNYAPGPMYTEMVEDAIRSDFAPIRDMYLEMKEKDSFVKPKDSVAKLRYILDAKKFESGSHIDIYDELSY